MMNKKMIKLVIIKDSNVKLLNFFQLNEFKKNFLKIMTVKKNQIN